MHSTRHLSFALGSAALLGLTLGACFTGEQAEGLPCTASSQCGPKLECIDGYCGGSGVSIYDQCGAEDVAFEFQAGPTAAGVDDPIGVLAGQFVGDDRSDLVLAQHGGSFVRIYDMVPGSPPEPYELVGDNTESPYFTTGVQAIAVYDFEQDTDTDILVLTEDSRLFGYFSDPDAGTPVLAAGAPYEILGQPKLIGLAMGKLDDDAWVDMVAVTEEGFVATATGNATKGMAGETPFDIDLSLVKLDGTEWDEVVLHDIDDDGIDELLVSGVDGQPRLWILARKPGMVLSDFWEPMEALQVPFMPSEFALGDLDGMGGIDIALLGRMSGRLVVLRQMGQGMFMPASDPIDLGLEINGLAVVDFDCSGHEDLVFNVESPAGVQVLLTGDMGELDATNSIEIASAGRPQGSLAVLKFDPDESWDVFHTVERAGDLDSDELRGLLSMPMGMPEP